MKACSLAFPTLSRFTLLLAAAFAGAALPPLAGTAFAIPAVCGWVGSLKSEAGIGATTIQFNNQDTQGHNVWIYWIDFTGKWVLYKELRPHYSWKINTYIGHYWVVATPDSGGSLACRDVIKGTPGNQSVSVGNY